MQNQLEARARDMKLSPDEQYFFTLVCRSEMRKTDFKRETKMDPKQIDNILKELNSRRLIKAIKLNGKKQNVWVRYDFKEEQATGKVDSSIVQVLREQQGELEVVRAQLKRKGYNVSEMDTVVQMLVNSGQKFMNNGRMVNRKIASLNNPCIGCPVFDVCCPGGVISPANCIYYDQW